jgi:hypothetical protein
MEIAAAAAAAAAYAAGGGRAGRPRVRAAGHPSVWTDPHVPAGAGRPPVEALALLLWDGGVRLRAKRGAAGAAGGLRRDGCGIDGSVD